jgi:hypothetical protein
MFLKLKVSLKGSYYELVAEDILGIVLTYRKDFQFRISGNVFRNDRRSDMLEYEYCEGSHIH